MKQTIRMFLIVLSLYSGTSLGQEAETITTSAVDLDSNPYRVPISSAKKGYLEKTEIAMGTILTSRHFDDEDYNESHNGIYLSFDEWSVGTYKNSSDVQSSFVSYNPKIYSKKSLNLNLVAGVADGYEGWTHAQGDYMPILGVSALWMNMRAMLSYDMVAFGFEIPLN